MERERKATLVLFLVSFVWGMTFIWMEQALRAANSVVPELDDKWVVMHFVAGRFIIATFLALLLLPQTRQGFSDSKTLKGGAWLGLIVGAGYMTQMIGLTDSSVTPAVSAFITSLYVVFTAIIGVFLGRQALTLWTVIGIFLATFGAGWISGPPQIEFGWGEWLTVIGAYIFGAHIIATDRVTKEVNPLQATGPMMLTIVLSAGTILSLAILLGGNEEINSSLLKLSLDVDYIIPLFLCGSLGSLFALGALNYYQRDISPVRAALVYAFEPVWAGIVSLLLGFEGEVTIWLFIGAGALLFGNIIVELEEILDQIFRKKKTPNVKNR